MKIFAMVEIKPGIEQTQAWDTVEHEGARWIVYGFSDKNRSILIPLDESKIQKLAPIFALPAEHNYTERLKLADAIAVELSD